MAVRQIHGDDDPVMFYYSSDRNISFQNTEYKDYDESGYTWREWRQLSSKDKRDILDEYTWGLVETGVVDDEY